MNDLAQSIVDGRLFRQVIRLANSSYRAVLVLEGTGKDITKAGVGREALQGALITVSLPLGVTILRSKGPMETAHLIAYAGRQIRSSARAGFQRRGYQPKGKRSRQLFILQALPGVGIERAIRRLFSETIGPDGHLIKEFASGTKPAALGLDHRTAALFEEAAKVLLQIRPGLDDNLKPATATGSNGSLKAPNPNVCADMVTPHDLQKSPNLVIVGRLRPQPVRSWIKHLMSSLRRSSRRI